MESLLDFSEVAQVIDGEETTRLAHYVTIADLERAMNEGTAATALCGKQWVPNRAPEHYPTCKACVKQFKRL